MKILALAGGVGGAKLAHGLAMLLPRQDLTIVVNTGDDFEHFGLRICPDLDTVCYTLAGLANPETGWGRADESWRVLDQLKQLGAPGWFNLGDLDLATHLERTRRLTAADQLSTITREFCQAWGVGPAVLPMTDDRVATLVETREYGLLPFQEYFVHLQCEPTVTGFRFDGISSARPAPGVLDALEQADAVVICPSNPWVSIGPILGLPGILDLLRQKITVAVSPLIGGKAVKGPAAKMYRELGVVPSAKAVADHYKSFLKGFILDLSDKSEANDIKQWGIISLVTNILMFNLDDRRRLASEILAFCDKLQEG